MGDDATRPLTDHEERYLEHLRAYLGDVSARDRKTLLIAAGQNLAERPPTTDWNELLRDLGGPRDYAAGLVGDLDVAAPGSVERSRRRQRRRRILIAAGVMILIVGAGLGFARWQTWQAEFTANTSAVCVGPDYPGDCDGTGLVDRSNYFGNVKQVMCVPGTKVTLVNGIVAHSAVTITGVDLGLPAGTREFFQLDDVVPWPMRQLAPRLRGNPEPGTWPLTVNPDSDETLLHLHLTLNCERRGELAGGSTTLLRVVVHYHALGKDREVWMPLLQALQITYPG